MQLTQEAIEEFKAIYKKEYGRDISDAEAREKGTRLLRLFLILLEADTVPPDSEVPLSTQNHGKDQQNTPH